MEEKKATGCLATTSKVRRCLVANIPEDVHKNIKTRSAWLGITMKDYIMEAVLEKIEREKTYE